MAIESKKIQINDQLRSRIDNILTNLAQGLIEREEVMKLTFLSALAGQTIFLLGPPGVAKSLIARRLKYAFKDAKSFEYLMHRFSTPDEVFGPISISKLKNDDKLERVVDYYLPGSNIAFLDEIWKAGPSIQNTLLTIINEKIYRNGEQEQKVDLFGIIAASNELPEEGQGLDALWDRFLLRIYVNNIENRQNFENMILETKNLYGDTIPATIKISKEEYNAWQETRDKISVPKEILDFIYQTRIKIESYNKQQRESENGKKTIYISDRRWKKIITLFRTSAFLNGRSFVDLMDCFLLPILIWDEPDQIETVKMIVKECIRYQGYTIGCNFGGIQRELGKLTNEINTETKFVKITKKTILKPYTSKFYKIEIPNTPFYIKITDFNNLPNYDKIPGQVNRPGYPPSSGVDPMSRKRFLRDHPCNLYKAPDETAPTTAPVFKKSEESVWISEHEYNIEKDDVEEQQILTKQPHSLLIQNWDQRITQLKNELKIEFEKIDRFVNEDLKFIRMNIFVDESNSNIIFEKIEEIKKNLHQLDLNMDEQYSKYHNITDGVIVETKNIPKNK